MNYWELLIFPILAVLIRSEIEAWVTRRHRKKVEDALIAIADKLGKESNEMKG